MESSSKNVNSVVNSVPVIWHFFQSLWVFSSIHWKSMVSRVGWTSVFFKTFLWNTLLCSTEESLEQHECNRIFIFGWAIPLNPNGLLTFSRWTFVKRSRSSQSSQCLNSLKRSALDFHFHRGFLVIIFSCRFVFDRQLILLRESAKLQQPFNKVPLVLLNISLPALLFHMPPLFHALIKETEHERMKERVIKMRSESRFQPFVMNIP